MEEWMKKSPAAKLRGTVAIYTYHIKGEGRLGYFLLRRLIRSISSLWRIMSSICWITVV